MRDAVRTLRRSPAYAAFILLVLAVAIAAATVTFSVVDAVVLRPLPFERPEQVVQIAARNLRGPYPLRSEEFRPVHDGLRWSTSSIAYRQLLRHHRHDVPSRIGLDRSGDARSRADRDRRAGRP